MKHYYYPPNDGGVSAVQEAFSNWKAIYNLSLCMTYGMRQFRRFPSIMTLICVEFYCTVSFIGVVWKTYSIPSDWSVGNELLRHTLGVVSRFIWLSSNLLN
jgi:phosphatidylethanolamine N-methyltransferase